ncbi:acyl-CoA dehydrogenase [Coralloluteibacterium stylophorae]|uniref:Acyl-CoA dehydrogenase n=1 Tax=Coralloluteibacterium stylophorae TaxID=1776034 RepID=A0A8J8AXM1_9GAMM|nr:acyl-CoA dehydrogenase [Coralloluteibacterium stylophorae]
MAQALRALQAAGFDHIPLPGGGDTLGRWRVLASVAARDLALVKLYEAHVDALAILHELGHPAPPRALLGVWAAEPPDAVVEATPLDAAGGLVLDGRKAWCSGGRILSHALVTVQGPAGERWLALVALDQPGVAVTDAGWHAVGMARVASGDVTFDRVRATRVGGDRAYLDRAGFWHGAIGVAACWHGAACAVAQGLRRSGRLKHDAHAQAHLGAVDAALSGARALLVEAARHIDEAPRADARVLALRVRAAVERAAAETLDRVGRALGAAPLCRDAAHAARCADLTTFLRQSHAERDLAALGAGIAAEGGDWLP